MDTKYAQFKPGVFSYSGFGMGTYYDTKGNAVWCNSSSAQELAAAEGVTFKWIDTLESALGYTTNWKDYLIN